MGVEDLISIGTIGLIKAINTFNLEKNKGAMEDVSADRRKCFYL